MVTSVSPAEKDGRGGTPARRRVAILTQPGADGAADDAGSLPLRLRRLDRSDRSDRLPWLPWLHLFSALCHPMPFLMNSSANGSMLIVIVVKQRRSLSGVGRLGAFSFAGW